MQRLIFGVTHCFGRSQAFPDEMVKAMPEGILVRPKPDYNKIAYQLRPRIHLTMSEEHVFVSSDNVNWVMKMDRPLALELARKVLELETKTSGQ
jgi:hypothetical protein